MWIDEDHHLLMIMNTGGLVRAEDFVSDDTAKFGDIDKEGFLNFDAF